MTSVIARVLLITGMLLTTACGFHLRGTIDVPEALQTVYVTGDKPSSAVLQQVRSSMAGAGVTLVEKASEAPYTLYIGEEREEKRTISLNRVAAAAEFQIRQFVSFEIRDQYRQLLSGPFELINERNFQNDINNVVGKRDEERLIREEMHKALAQQIIRRYQSLDPNQLTVSQKR
jgi:LPS-assembly lipoprotein